MSLDPAAASAAPVRGAWTLLDWIPAELTHALGIQALRVPLWLRRAALRDDPFEWRGHRFRNRVGIAAGLDKNAVALRALERMGAGFVEVGTVLARPWAGQPRPRLDRLSDSGALWNRLGFPSDGLDRVVARLAATPQVAGFVRGCNIAPHPLTVKGLADGTATLATARDELVRLAKALHPHAELFVVNLSSPNTPGLRALLQSGPVAEQLVVPVLQTLRECDASAGRSAPTLLLLKLPPETSPQQGWTPESLASFLAPFTSTEVCDGFVAVNTSTRLALAMARHALPDRPGGVSGAPLHATALEVMAMLREIGAPDQLRVGVGGIRDGASAAAMLRAGAHLVEVYSGLVYAGPSLIAECVETLRAAGPFARA